jgi:hypothetical protein
VRSAVVREVTTGPRGVAGALPSHGGAGGQPGQAAGDGGVPAEPIGNPARGRDLDAEREGPAADEPFRMP